MTDPSRILSEQTQVGSVTLLVRNLPQLSEFYRVLLGLEVIEQTAQQVTLGTNNLPLLMLRAAPALPAPSSNRPGLYHIAFLQPTRADLGRWLAHAAHLKLRLGSGDHLVSEAFYLHDPEGNGIEVYADRPRDTWIWENGQVKMDTLAVDAASVLREAGLEPQALGGQTFGGIADSYHTPAGLKVGHVHLKVGNAAQAAQFYQDTLGLNLVSLFPGAAFLSWGGYHHHVGLNEWHTRGHGKPAAPAAGLGGVTFSAPDLSGLRRHLQHRPDVQDHGTHLTLQDPWDNELTVQQG